MRQSLATRLAGLYAMLLGITIVIVILASSIALVVELTNFTFTHEVMMAKHEQAREIASRSSQRGIPLSRTAEDIVNSVSSLGLRVSVYDTKGHFLAGEKTVRPALLDRVVAGEVQLPGPNDRERTPPPGPHGMPPPPPFRDPASLTAVDGGYVAFEPSLGLLLVALVPYWRIIVTIAVIAIVLSWFVGRLFAGQALRPINEVTSSLRALADGDFTQRRFVSAAGDEIGFLTAAYNDAAASVAHAMEERRQTEGRMRQFVADAGHELRTPLTVIGGYIDVLRRGAIEEPRIAKQILGTMSLEKEHMRVLIDRLMRLARLDSETPPKLDRIDLAELLRSQVEAAKRLDETRQIDYSLDGATEVEGDRAELGEAVWNLVENALKYAEDAPIHLRARRNDGNTQIVVNDEGPGMSEIERIHAFERFYRGDQRGEIPGTGLGLAIAKRAVERAGGQIDLESTPGRGTTVTITL